MVYDYDFDTKIIDIPFGIASVDVLNLITDIREAEATIEGVRHGQIASGSGNESLGGAVYVGITIALLDDWQIRFAAGNYIARVSGGNLVGGLGGDPIAYSAGVQVLLVQSAASTVVVTSDGLGGSDLALLATAATEATRARQLADNDAWISEDGTQSIIYDDDGVTPIRTFSHPTPRERRGA